MKLRINNEEVEIRAPSSARLTPLGNGKYELSVEGRKVPLFVARDARYIWVAIDGIVAKFEVPQEDSLTGEAVVRAPMTARVVKLFVSPGDSVQVGDIVAVLEAMKMEYRLEAKITGTVAEVGVAEGDLVDLGQVIVKLG